MLDKARVRGVDVSVYKLMITGLKMARTLTDRFIRTATPGFYRDGGCPTLNLRVTPARTRQWVQRLAVHGRERQLGLGGYPLVPLAEAREKALSNRRLARAGGDPCALKRAQRAPTFAAARPIPSIAIHRDGWKGAGKSEAQWRASLRDYAMKRPGLENRSTGSRRRT